MFRSQRGLDFILYCLKTTSPGVAILRVLLCNIIARVEYNFGIQYIICRSQWPRGLRRSSAAAPLLRLWVQIPAAAWISVCCECCVLSGRGVCNGLITRSEKSYCPWFVIVCDLETSRMRRPWFALGRNATGKIIHYLCASI